MRIAVIGAGSIGQRHMRNLLTLGCDRMVVCDIAMPEDGSGGHRLFKDVNFITQVFRSTDGIWGWPKIVFVCTPPATHLDYARQAIEHNCHVFVEKPLSTTDDVDAWLELQRLADEKHLVTMCSCNWRYHEASQAFKQAIESRLIRPPYDLSLTWSQYLPDWRPGTDWRQHYSATKEQGGVLTEAGWHFIDLATWMLGPAKLRYFEGHKATELGLECDGFASLTFDHKNGESHVEVRMQVENFWRFCLGGRRGVVQWEHEVSTAYDPNQMYLDELQAFLRAVQDGGLSPNPIGSAVETLKLILEAKARVR